jgi:hypothetical protein
MKNFYKCKNAIVILGGTSIKKYLSVLRNINKEENVIFAETKCISKKLYENQIFPDFIICPFSNKLKDNYFQNIIYRSFLRKVNIKFFIKKKFFHEVDYLKLKFDEIYEVWRPHKGINKNLKYKNNIYLKNSPFENLDFFPDSKIILNKSDYLENFPDIKLNNQIINLKFIKIERDFNQKDYFDIDYSDNAFYLKESNFLNSQAICHFPILNYLGFKKIFFLGMDMNFFGSYAYDFKEIFKSTYHLYLYLFIIRKTLNGNFKMNFPIYLRPKEEFNNLEMIIPSENNFYRVVDKSNYVKVPKLNEISIKDFLNTFNLQNDSKY